MPSFRGRRAHRAPHFSAAPGVFPALAGKHCFSFIVERLAADGSAPKLCRGMLLMGVGSRAAGGSENKPIHLFIVDSISRGFVFSPFVWLFLRKQGVNPLMKPM